MIMDTLSMKHLLCVLVLAEVICSTAGLFNYRCDVLDCEAGDTCAPPAYACACAATKKGVPCKTNQPCGSSARCVEAHTISETDKCSSATRCICLEGYYGDNCEHKRVRATCLNQGITIFIKTYYKADNTYHSSKAYFATDPVEFDGALDSLCSVNINGDGVLTKVLPASDSEATVVPPCYKALREGDLEVYFVYVQQVNLYRTASDQIFRVECDTSTGIEASVSTVAPAARTTPKLETSSRLDGVTMQLMKEGATSSDPPVPITSGGTIAFGETLLLVLESAILIGTPSCTASDGSDQTATLLTDWCVPMASSPLYKKPIEVADDTSAGGNHKITYTLGAWKFVASSTNALQFTCNVCRTRDCSGLPPTCVDGVSDVALSADLVPVYGQFANAERRRREIISNGDQTTLSVGVTVGDNPVDVTVNGQGSESSSIDVASCYKSISVLLPIILLVILLIFTMAMTFFFCLRLTNQVKQKEVNSNMGYKS